MGYTNRRATIKWWHPHTKKLKYCLPAKFDEHNNKFVKVWSPGSIFMTRTNVYALTTLNNYISDHPFIKDGVFEATVNFPPRGIPISIIVHYC